jgi:hypothetical protein
VEDYYRAYDAGKERAKQADGSFVKAEQAESDGHWNRARELLDFYLQQTAIERDSVYFEPPQRQLKRNSAVDQLDAISTLDSGASPGAVKAYLEARRIYDRWAGLDPSEIPGYSNGGHRSNPPDREGLAETLKSALSQIPAARGVDANAGYLRAAVSYQSGRYEEAAAAFTGVSANYARSPKREAALYMRAVSLLKSSANFSGTSGDEAHVEASFTKRRETQPVECCDRFWRQASNGFARVEREYPRGRYLNDAHGWLAYLKLRAGDRSGALLDYYRLLNDKDPDTRTKAVFSLELVRHHATDEELDRLEALLEKEPVAALAYAYHTIYNYAIDPGCPLEVDWTRYDQDRQEKRELGRKELTRIATFVGRLLRRYPRMAIGAAFSVRAGAVDLELGNNQAALGLAKRAIAAGASGRERAMALWVKGSAEHRLSRFHEAQRTLSGLIGEKPGTDLVDRARKLLAAVEEDSGNYEAALEQYLALDYTVDAAYFIDILMSPESLAHFIATNAGSPYRDGLFYSLGLKYMRKGMWADARRAFSQVHTSGETGHNATSYSPWSDGSVFKAGRMSRTSPKVTDSGMGAQQGVRKAWLLQDLASLNDLERLERDVEDSSGQAAKAEALYRLASYQYDGSTMMYYNPWAWGSTRLENLEGLDASAYRTAGEAEKVWQYFQAHEPVVHALDIYMRIADSYPGTRVAPLALYTAAVCQERLSNYNGYWSNAYSNGRHAGIRMITYQEVRARYPKFQLPRGTIGWEPSNGTVNGGPAWAAPPRGPRPAPFRERLLRIAQQRVQEAWDSLVRITIRAIQFVVSMLVLAMIGILTWLMVSSKRKLIAEVRACRGIPRALLPPHRSEIAKARCWAVPKFSIFPGVSFPGMSFPGVSWTQGLIPKEPPGYEGFLGNAAIDEWALAARARLYPFLNYIFNSAGGVAFIVHTFSAIVMLSVIITVLLLL